MIDVNLVLIKGDGMPMGTGKAAGLGIGSGNWGYLSRLDRKRTQLLVVRFAFLQ